MTAAEIPFSQDDAVWCVLQLLFIVPLIKGIIFMAEEYEAVNCFCGQLKVEVQK